VASASRDAFIGAFATSMRVATGVTAAGVVVAVCLIRSRRESRAEAEETIAAATPAPELAAGERAAT
jgi:ABC-type spermidine/putrescine transport system permease subunit II